MSEIINIVLRLDKIPRDRIREVARQDGKVGMVVNLSVIAVKGGVDQYGNSHFVVVRKTKEEFDAKAPTIFCGSGRQAKLKSESPSTGHVSTINEDDYPY